MARAALGCAESCMADFVKKKILDQALGDFFEVDKGNVQVDLANGRFTFRQAEIKADAFDELHLPFTIYGGFVDEISANFSVGMFTSGGSAKVVVNNVSLLVGPHTTDWSWEHVLGCKSKLVDLVLRLQELKHMEEKKKRARGTRHGYFDHVMQTVVEDVLKRVLAVLEVHISNIHIRYEDSVTQENPFAGGIKLGLLYATASVDPKQLRTTGDWKGSSKSHADMFFCQSIVTRRLSAYWDVDVSSELFAVGPVRGDEARRIFARLNTREMFSACVVETILASCPPGRRPSRHLEGPIFRERFDFHRYILFPTSISVHALVNRMRNAVRTQKAPMADVDLVCDSLELAIDTQQLRSVNQLVSYVLRFNQKDELFLTRPRHSLGSMGTEPPTPERRALLRAWWWHALRGVQVLCDIPVNRMSSLHLPRYVRLREEYIRLCLAELASKEDIKAEMSGTLGSWAATRSMSRQFTEEQRQAAGDAGTASLVDRLRCMQMSIQLDKIIDWRGRARSRKRAQQERQASMESEASHTMSEGGGGRPMTTAELLLTVLGSAATPASSPRPEAEEPLTPQRRETPETLQVCLHVKVLQIFFLEVPNASGRSPIGDPLSPRTCSPRSQTALPKESEDKTIRHLLVSAEILDNELTFLQKGRAEHRLATWLEIGVGSVSVKNWTVREDSSVHQILDIKPFEHREGKLLSIFVGVTTLEVHSHDCEPGDGYIGTVLNPGGGVEQHLRQCSAEATFEERGRLGVLKDYWDDLGVKMTFAYVRVGEVNAIDYSPFRRQLIHLAKLGMDHRSCDLARRPSKGLLDRQMPQELQMAIEEAVGKPHMMGFVEGSLAGVLGRSLDIYTAQYVQCKQISLGPVTFKAVRNGGPQTLDLQVHEYVPSEAVKADSSFPLTSLPWKVQLVMLSKRGLKLIDFEEKMRYEPVDTLGVQYANTSACDLTSTVLAGTSLLKWGRNGRARRHFVMVDERLKAIVWKRHQSDTKPRGAIPLSKVLDICVGIKTPVLRRVASWKLRPDRVLSIISDERTLDLQAETVALRQCWVAGLQARFKIFMMDYQEDDLLTPELKKVSKAYPAKFRSDKRALRNFAAQMPLTPDRIPQ